MTTINQAFPTAVQSWRQARTFRAGLRPKSAAVWTNQLDNGRRFYAVETWNVTTGAREFVAAFPYSGSSDIIRAFSAACATARAARV